MLACWPLTIELQLKLQRLRFLRRLYYLPLGDNALDWLEATDITNKVSFSNKNSNSILKYKMSVYALNGTWLGFREVQSTDLQFCGGLLEEVSDWRRFGTDYTNECEVDLGVLLEDSQEPLFYELYYQDGLSTQLIPVPVRILNYQSQGRFVNEPGQDEDRQQLERRFFLKESASSQESATGK